MLNLHYPNFETNDNDNDGPVEEGESKPDDYTSEVYMDPHTKIEYKKAYLKAIIDKIGYIPKKLLIIKDKDLDYFVSKFKETFDPSSKEFKTSDSIDNPKPFGINGSAPRSRKDIKKKKKPPE